MSREFKLVGCMQQSKQCSFLENIKKIKQWNVILYINRQLTFPVDFIPLIVHKYTAPQAAARDNTIHHCKSPLSFIVEVIFNVFLYQK